MFGKSWWDWKTILSFGNEAVSWNFPFYRGCCSCFDYEMTGSAVPAVSHWPRQEDTPFKKGTVPFQVGVLRCLCEARYRFSIRLFWCYLDLGSYYCRFWYKNRFNSCYTCPLWYYLRWCYILAYYPLHLHGSLKKITTYISPFGQQKKNTEFFVVILGLFEKLSKTRKALLL